MGRVSNKVVIVTGAGSGIGKACMELFAKEGAKVFGIGRTKSKVDAVAAELRAQGAEAGSAAADLSDFASTQRAFAEAIGQFGRVDILVNNAGVGYSWAEQSPGSMNDTVTCEPEKWREVMAINLDSVFNMCKLAVPVMQKNGGGSIVNIASIWGMLGAGDAHAYTASKGAIINYTRSLCVAYAKDNIRANTLCPG
ncbi:MAG: SDR family oxidoreductase, partial [Steroidobacteraceae bacterium]|nr:SDR family oxidoreductase [Steroidobacteraceae bacterium]